MASAGVLALMAGGGYLMIRRRPVAAPAVTS
jgi:hypothetical protein